MFEKFYLKKYLGLLTSFELIVIRDGNEMNICDLGAGLWQMLHPWISLNLADSMKQQRHFMLQQPDENTHPRLQEHMASLYCNGLKNGHRFLIKTHSDYSLNRISSEIKDGEVDPNHISVAILSMMRENNPVGFTTVFLTATGHSTTCQQFSKNYTAKTYAGLFDNVVGTGQFSWFLIRSEIQLWFYLSLKKVFHDK